MTRLLVLSFEGRKVVEIFSLHILTIRLKLIRWLTTAVVQRRVLETNRSADSVPPPPRATFSIIKKKRRYTKVHKCIGELPKNTHFLIAAVFNYFIY